MPPLIVKNLELVVIITFHFIDEETEAERGQFLAQGCTVVETVFVLRVRPLNQEVYRVWVTPRNN